MQKQIWYGADDANNVRFADNQSVLKSAGITNPQSFTVDGQVHGLNLVTENTQQNTGSGQPA